MFAVSGLAKVVPETAHLEIAPVEAQRVTMQFTVVHPPPPEPEPEPEPEEEPKVEEKQETEAKLKEEPSLQPKAKPKKTQKKIQKKSTQKKSNISKKSSKTSAKPKVLRSIRPNYPARAKSKGIQGTAHVRVKVNSDGRVTSARIQRSSGSSLLDNAAVTAARRWTFTRGNPSSVTIPFTFSLKRR